jgi:hypothetical protein
VTHSWAASRSARPACPSRARSTAACLPVPHRRQPTRAVLARQPLGAPLSRGRRVMVTRQPGHRPLVEVLYVGDCPHYAGALVERIRGELGIDSELRTSLIGDQAAAERARFPGSPTIRVDGRDIEPGSEPSAELSVACRLYRHERGLAGQPAEAWVRDALLAAGRTHARPEPEQRSTIDQRARGDHG